MEKVVGPIGGYYVAIVARKIDGKFQASYKVCAIAPADYSSACALRRRRLPGLSNTPVEAMEIAEQVARLSVARLRDEDEAKGLGKLPRMKERDFDSSIGEDSPPRDPGRLYAPTEPAPLYETTEAAPVYAATMPCPLR